MQIILFATQLSVLNFTDADLNAAANEDDMKIFAQYEIFIKVINCIMLALTLYFLAIESIQLKDAIEKGNWRNYFDSNNNRDVTMAILQIYLFSYRILHPIDVEEYQRMKIGVLNVFLLAMMISKVFFYLKIFDRFSVIVNLISEIMLELKPFMIIFILFTWFFALSYNVLGGEFNSITIDFGE